MPENDPEVNPTSPEPSPAAASSAPEATPRPTERGEGATPAEALAATGGDGAEIPPSEEREIWAARTSWKHFYGRWAAWAAVMIVLVVGAILIRGRWTWLDDKGTIWILGAMSVVILGSGAVLWVRFAIKIFSVHYRLTSQRLFVGRGILSRTTDQTELIRVDDVRVKQGLIDRIVDCGTVEVVSTDVSDAMMPLIGIAGPDKIAEHIRQNMRALRKKSLFIENL